MGKSLQPPRIWSYPLLVGHPGFGVRLPACFAPSKDTTVSWVWDSVLIELFLTCAVQSAFFLTEAKQHEQWIAAVGAGLLELTCGLSPIASRTSRLYSIHKYFSKRDSNPRSLLLYVPLFLSDLPHFRWEAMHVFSIPKSSTKQSSCSVFLCVVSRYECADQTSLPSPFSPSGKQQHPDRLSLTFTRGRVTRTAFSQEERKGKSSAWLASFKLFGTGPIFHSSWGSPLTHLHLLSSVSLTFAFKMSTHWWLLGKKNVIKS